LLVSRLGSGNYRNPLSGKCVQTWWTQLSESQPEFAEDSNSIRRNSRSQSGHQGKDFKDDGVVLVIWQI